METPGWFQNAVDQTPEDHTVSVNGIDVHYLRWGPRNVPGLIFVHGGAAHAHWWSHIAPMFLGTRDQAVSVAALDLSGHGDSGRRDEYSLEGWVDEVIAVIADAGFSSPPIVVGHSMGGFVAVATAATACDAVGGVVVIDSPIIDVDPEVRAARGGKDFSPKQRVYESLEAALGRFRTVPAQEHYLPFVMDMIAQKSLKKIDGGFTWKFDPRVFGDNRRASVEFLPNIQCRVALLRAEHGLVTPEIGEYMYDKLGRVAPVIVLPEAGHHPMLDVPLILVTALRSLLADWAHSTPHRRGQAPSSAEAIQETASTEISAAGE